MRNFKRGNNVTINANCHIGDNVTLEDNVYIDFNCIIRDNVTIKAGTTIGPNCVLGEHQMDFYGTHSTNALHPLVIGENSIIRSGSVIYGDTIIGRNLHTGHTVTIREKTNIGNFCSIGTLSDIQGDCQIGDYVRCHSNVFISSKTTIGNYVWIFPHAIITNDPTPPSNTLLGVTVEEFAVIAAGAIIRSGVHIEKDTLVAAGAIVIKDVKSGEVVGGNPAKTISHINKIVNKSTGEHSYPWREHFKRGMPWENSDYKTWFDLRDFK